MMRSLQDSHSSISSRIHSWLMRQQPSKGANKQNSSSSFNSSLSVWHARSFPLLGGPKSFVTLRGYSAAAAAVAGKLRYPRVSLMMKDVRKKPWRNVG
jgi:hypothetical protein